MTSNINETSLPPPPPVLWAQRKNLLYVKIAVEDGKDPTIKIEKDKLYYKGKGGEGKEYEITLNFYKDIKVEESKYVVRDRGVECVLIKAEDGGPYWKRLLKDEKKHHWLKVDFNKWRDEDESDEEMGGGTDFEEMMRQMGGLGGGGGGGTNDLGDLDGDADSDDEDLPDLEKKD